MPTVDFTLADVAKQTTDIVTQALINEREHTRVMVEDIVTTQFMSFWDHNLGPVLNDIYGRLDNIDHRFTDVEHNVNATGLLVAQHSQHIMTLRAREA